MPVGRLATALAASVVLLLAAAPQLAGAQTPTPVEVTNQVDLAPVLDGIKVVAFFAMVSSAAAFASVVALCLGFFRR